MRHVLDTIISALNRDESVILCSIVRSSGSAPRTSGARMVVLTDGGLAGSVGGGIVEGDCRKAAGELLAGSDTHAQLDFSLSAEGAADQGMVCGGSVTVLLQNLEPSAVHLFMRLRHAYVEGRRPLLLTVLPFLGAAPQLLTFGAGEDAQVPAELRESLQTRKDRVPFTVEQDGREIFVEPLVHPGTVHLVGAGHVALATAHIACFVGFDVVVMDDRADFANTARYPQAREVRVLDGFANCLAELGPDDYVVIVTRGHIHDRDVLAQALRTGAGYIGMIGSKRKRQAVYAWLRGEGFTEMDLKRVHNPIGLPIGADTPEEIGVSIVAEMIQIRAQSDQ
jgi:xanthine dehydrogenase accessory factor